MIIGDIYTSEFSFGDPVITKERPVVIVDIDKAAGLYYVMEITSIGPHEPPKYHDQFKVPILNWRSVGLNKPSWTKVTNVHEVDESALYNYRGHMSRSDSFKIMNVLLIINEQS